MKNIHLSSSKIFSDERGFFFPLSLNGVSNWSQSNISCSKKWVFRGMHHQRGESAQNKFITVISGRIIDFVVDLRKENFLDSRFFVMNPGDQIFVPRGCAHGFLALEEDTTIQYLVDFPYSPSSEISFDWKSNPVIQEVILAEVGDPSNLIINQKDAEGAQFSSEFLEESL
jgi:dTDP-4-dehydrorhamnose 3,5-epimerase